MVILSMWEMCWWCETVQEVVQEAVQEVVQG